MADGHMDILTRLNMSRRIARGRSSLRTRRRCIKHRPIMLGSMAIRGIMTAIGIVMMIIMGDNCR